MEPTFNADRASEFRNSPSTGRRYVGLVVFTLIGIGLMCVAAFYQSELTVYFTQQGWNTGAVEQVTREFIKSAHGKKSAAGALLDEQWVKPVVKGNTLTGVTQPGATGPVTTPIRSIVPADEVKKVVIRLKFKAGDFESAAEYPDGRWAVFTVRRNNGVLKIRKIATELTKEQPQPKPWD